jgi:SAM-dependent methyltransferase
MRTSAVQDCLRVLAHFGIDPASGQAIDVGGTERVHFDSGDKRNPLLDINSTLTFLDKGFNIKALGTRADKVADLLDPEVVEALEGRFDIAFCFDTLEHVPDPFKFCGHLLRTVRPGGYVYLATVFEWRYHPSPEDYFRFSPTGLREVFRRGAELSRVESTTLWCDWESDRRAVAFLARRGPRLPSDPLDTLVLPAIAVRRGNWPWSILRRMLGPRRRSMV